MMFVVSVSHSLFRMALVYNGSECSEKMNIKIVTNIWITKTAVFVGCGNENAHGKNRKKYKMAVASLKANHVFLFSQSKICKQKFPGLRRLYCNQEWIV